MVATPYKLVLEQCNAGRKNGESFLKKIPFSLSDFMTGADHGNSYGQMTLTFIPVDPETVEDCGEFLNSVIIAKDDKPYQCLSLIHI